MELKKLMIDSKSVWVDFQGSSDFSVEVASLSRTELSKLRTKCTHKKFNRSLRISEEILDEERFVSEFTKVTVKNWKGLTLDQLGGLVLINMGDNKPEDELEYTQENAEMLVNNSIEFDTWLNEVVFDLDNFRGERKGRGLDALK